MDSSLLQVGSVDVGQELYLVATGKSLFIRKIFAIYHQSNIAAGL
jgi:hypothetical protein